MLSRLRRRGFTLIELMIVVAIIGILAAIAIPNFIKFQARAKQGEPKSNLKALFTAQKSFFQEKDRYSILINEIGFTPERGNRYDYENGACAWQVRSSATLSYLPADSCITVDNGKYPAPAPSSYTGLGLPGTTGVAGTCPGCDFWAVAAGNVDNESSGVDSWFISSTDMAAAAGACGNADTGRVAGLPFNTYNDVNCN